MDPQRPRTLERPLPSGESAPRPEQGLERSVEGVEQTETSTSSVETPVATHVMTPVAAAPPAPAVDPELQRIEDTLADGLGDVYKTLPPSIKPAFKKKGEEVARTIQLWTQGEKLVAHKVLRLIREWLGMIPRVNAHYLEQQSKIKTDQVMRLAQEQKEET